MKLSTDDQIVDKLHEVKGAIRQEAGEQTKNSILAADWKSEKNAVEFSTLLAK